MRRLVLVLLLAACGDAPAGGPIDAAAPDAPLPDAPSGCTQDEECDDFNACTEDLCEAGACTHKPWRQGDICNDQLACTDDDRCDDGVCVGRELDCTFLNDVCNLGRCDEAFGGCVVEPLADGTPCDDGVFCTDPDVCVGGTCTSAPRDCSAAADACNAAACDEGLVTCVKIPFGDGTPCDDGLFCTVGEVCGGGACAGGPRDCSSATDACNAGACDEAADACVGVPRSDGTSCDDGNACTTGDACAGGACAGAAVDCSSLTDACGVGTCDASGACVRVLLPDGTACDDGDACSTGETCAAGACAGGAAVACDDGNACTSDSCQAASGCVHTPIPPIPNAEGPPGHATCADGVDNDCDGPSDTADPDCVECVGAADCDDGNPCTADACTASLCEHLPLEAVACDDGFYCTVGETCSGGACGGGAPRDCSAAGSTCTAGACDEASAACVGLPANEGGACDDGLACTIGDVCTGGSCAGTPVSCTGLDGACVQGVCNPATGACEAVPANEGGACDDGVACTAGDACSGGICAGAPVDCSGVANACNVGVCHPATGACQAVPTNEGGACDDGLYCTVGETCSAGACAGGAPRSCADTNACTTDACDEALDACTHTPIAPIPGAEGPPGDPTCTDGDDDDCDGLADLSDPDCVDCFGDGDCDDGNACTTDSCTVGVCQNTPLTGTACDDGLYCTTGDTCTAGVCAGASRDCSAMSNACNVGACNEAIDACVATPANQGAACDDGLYCTVGDTCNAGVCGGAPRDCSALSGACSVGSCNEAIDSCVPTPANEGGACDDGFYCTVGETCGSGACGGGAPRDCSALSGACSVGSCNEATDACVATPANEGGACDDGLYCTVGDTCSAGACGGAPRDCSALSNACNAGTCNEATDACVATPANEGGACDDGLLCTAMDTCSGGSCAGLPVDCSGVANACNLGVCNPSTGGCQAQPTNEGGACSDGLYCTVNDSCAAGSCGGAPRDCSGVAGTCQVGACNEALDVCQPQAAPNGTSCEGVFFCQTGETCTGGACGGGAPVTCSDGNVCTTDMCDETGDACVNTPRTVAASSLVTTSSDDGTPLTVCLTAGTGGRVLVWTELVANDGAPAVGASVTIGGVAATASTAKPGTYYREVVAPATPGTTTLSVAATWCGTTVILSTTVQLTTVAANTSGGGLAGCSPMDGNLRVRVVTETGAPISGASVLVGMAQGTPFETSPEALFGGASAPASNVAMTNSSGYATFHDYGNALAGPVTVTAGAASRAYFTVVDGNAADLVLALPLRNPAAVTTTAYDNGTGTTGGSLPTGCADIDAAVVLPKLDLDFFSTFDTGRLFEQNRCWNHGNANINGGNPIAVPENMWIPSQSIGPLCLGGALAEARWTLRLKNTSATGVTENIVMNLQSAPWGDVQNVLASNGGFAELLPITTYRRIGFILNESVPTAPTSGRSINANETYPNNYSVTWTGAPPGTDVVGTTGADYAGTNGVGPVFLIGHKVKKATDAGSTVAIPNSDLNAMGTPSGVRRFAAVSALYLDPDADAPANRRRAVSTVLIRDNGSGGAPFGATGGSISLTSTSSPTTFLGLVGTTYLPATNEFRWQNVTNAGNAPMYSVHELTVLTRRHLPVLSCATSNNVREEFSVQWIVARPFAATCAAQECFTLPTLPASFPEAAAGTQKMSGFAQLVGSGRPCATSADCVTAAGESCVDPDGMTGEYPRMCMGGAGTAASPYFRQDYVWRPHVYDLQLAPTFDFQNFVFANRLATVTHESSNRHTISSGPYCYPATGATLACGGSHMYNTTSAGTTDEVDHYACDPNRSLTGREYTYTFTTTTTRTVTVNVTSAMGVNVDVVVLSPQGGACDPDGCVAQGDTSATFTAVAGQTYHIVVDGWAGSEGGYTVSVACP